MKRMHSRTLLCTIALAVAAGTVRSAQAQTSVASVAAMVGTVNLQRGPGGASQAAALGSSIFAGDVIRTGSDGVAKLSFTDDSVLNIGPSTELTLERHGKGKAPRVASLRLAQGTVEALVSARGGEGARYEVDTPTAVARVQGTDFIVRYDAAVQATDVAALEGSVAVQGTTGIIGPAVVVAPGEQTRIPRDGFPSPAKAMDAADVRGFTQPLQLVGTGAREGLDTDNPTLDGRVVDAADHPVAAAGVSEATVENDEYLRPGVPGQTLIQSLSPDIRANSQPLPEYRAVPPNAVPVPPH
jgi:ferric-dicitrate binding protein FerR (iron transport regulator)